MSRLNVGFAIEDMSYFRSNADLLGMTERDIAACRRYMRARDADVESDLDNEGCPPPLRAALLSVAVRLNAVAPRGSC